MTLSLVKEQFGNLTVLEKDDDKCIPKFIYWKCQCSCGNIVSVLTNNLRSGNTKSCGCSKHKRPNNFSDISGQLFGKLLTIEKISHPTQKWVSYWKCKCACGNFTSVKRSHLINGTIVSCGSCGKTTSKSRSLSHGGSGFPKKRHKVLSFIRGTKEYKLWLALCKELANNRCSLTNTNQDLHVHHINSLKSIVKDNKITKDNYKHYAYLLFDVKNGFVMSKQLHVEFHKKFGYYTTKEQLDQFILENS